MSFTEAHIKDGIDKCLLNAKSLIEDATLLKDNNRLERSYTLFQFAIEEIGKVFRLYTFYIFEDINNKKVVDKFWRDFKDHKEKTKKAIASDFYVLLVAKKAIPDKLNFLKASAYEIENVDTINDRKNNSLYTSFIKGVFKTPKEIITPELLSSIEFRATTRYEVTKSFMQASLSLIGELRQFNLTNPLDHSDPKLIEEFWDDLSS